MSSFRKQAALLGLTAAVFAASTAQADEKATNLDTSTTPTPVANQSEKTVAATGNEKATASEKTDLPAKQDENATPVASTEATPSKEGSLADDKALQPTEGQEVDVRILATTDLHTNLVNYDYYQDKPAENVGLAKTAVLIEEAKKENSNTLLVDNGDTIQGTPLGTYKAIVNPVKEGEQHPMYAALQKLGFEAGTLGNHEFNYGLDYLKRVIDTAGMPIVNDPTKKEAQQLINPSYRTYNFDVIDGVTYEYDVTQPNKYDREGKLIHPDASRVRNLKYQGKDVRPDQEFIVVTNNYRANGNFPGVRDASLNRLLGLENRQVIINYILDVKNINPSADKNWHFTNSIKGLDVRFLTADKAKNLVGTDGDIQYLASSDQEGFGEYRLLYIEPKTEPAETNHHEVQDTQGQNQGDAITLSNGGQTIILPSAHNPIATTLPNTGEKTSILTFLGVILAGFGLSLKKKEE